MATKSTYIINAVEATNSSIYLWKITNLITGSIRLMTAQTTTLELENPSNSATSTDYNFVFNKNQQDQLCINVLDVKYIGGGTSAPAYNAPATDLASILALI